MKKFAFIMVLAALMGCGNAQNNENKEQNGASTDSATETATVEQEQTPNNNTMKALVTYFSASGVTRNAANELAGIIGADLFEITPETLYTEADLDWQNKQSRSSVEMADKTSRPALKDGGKVDLANYDVVFVGFPIWWYTAPTIINTFIEANDFTGKTIVPFATSGGSNIKKSCEDLQAAYPDYKFGEGRLLNSIDKADIEAWAASVK